MANYSVLKAAVQSVVKTNGNGAITGANLQTTLLAIIDALGAGYQFMGVATPSTTPPSSPDYSMAYIGGAGSYSNFGTSVVVPPTNIAIFTYNGSWTCTQVTVEHGGVFDISAFHASGSTLATYADLSAALGTNGANVPDSIRKGGMSVKFVQSYDNKYVQYFLTKDEWSANEADWQKLNLEEEVSQLGQEVNDNCVVNAKRIAFSEWGYVHFTIKSGEKIIIRVIKSSGVGTALYATPEQSVTDQVLICQLASCATYNFTASADTNYLRFAGQNITNGAIIEVIRENGLWSDVNNITQKILEIQDAIYDYPVLESESSESGYIKNDGSIGTLQNSSVYKYSLDGISKVRITNSLRVGSLALYGFYSSSEFSSATAIKIGVLANASEFDTYIEDVPSEATYLGISKYLVSQFGAEDLSNGVSELDVLDSEIQEINNKIGTKYVELPGLITTGSYIKNNGDIATSTGFALIQYALANVSKIKITNSQRIGSNILYAFYSSSEFSSSTLLKKGPAANESTTNDYVEDVPSGAAYLLISIYATATPQYGAQSIESMNIGEELANIHSDLSDIKVEISPYAFSFDGNNLYVTYNNGGVETCYWFKKCMANLLFTFFRVGYRLVTRDYPSTDGIRSQADITPINETGSDNIGPFRMGNDLWVGGNHKLEVGEKEYLTAKTDSYKVYIDGKELSSSASGMAGSICIKVQNTLYDPAFIPSDPDATILDTPLCTEYATYVINKNTIEVALRHSFSSTTSNSITNYYGMQSMFKLEDYFMTPNGAYPNWESVDNVTGNARFTKGDYPHFNRFIEKNTTTAAFQSTYIFDDFGLGSHYAIPNDGFVFTRGNTGKDYHHLIDEGQITPLANKIIMWRGAYTFFHTPLIDDNYMFAYLGSIGGKDALFVNTKQAVSGRVVPIPSAYALKEISVRECYGITDQLGGTDFYIGADGLYIVSESTGSLILVFNP